MTCAGMLKLPRVATRRSETRAMASGRLAAALGRAAAGAPASGSSHWRFSASCEGERHVRLAGAPLRRRRRCAPARAARRRRPRPPAPGAARRAAARLAEDLRRRRRAVDEVRAGRLGPREVQFWRRPGDTDVRIRSLASMVGDSSSSTTRVSAPPLRRAPEGLGLAARGRRPALAPRPCLRVVRPLAQRRAGHQQDAGDERARRRGRPRPRGR